MQKYAFVYQCMLYFYEEYQSLLNQAVVHIINIKSCKPRQSVALAMNSIQYVKLYKIKQFTKVYTFISYHCTYILVCFLTKK